MTAQYKNHDGIAVITLDNPPINSLGMNTRQAVDAGFTQALADPGIKAIVITGGNGVFTGGADIKEFGKPIAMQSPTLHDLIARFEMSPKPVISAIDGVCMGGGTEISLGCHYRLAAPGVMIGLPEVKIGILPGAGGTQRLPRVAGVELALNMIVSGDPVRSDALAKVGAIDRLIEGDFLAGVLAFANEVAATRPLPRVRDRKVEMPDAAAFFAAVRAKVAASSKGFPAPVKCVDAVEAAVLRDIDEGLAYEFELFSALVTTPESAALRHAFFAERAASKIPDVPDDTPVRQVKAVAVIGAGTMGGGITMNFLNAGIPVTLLETKQEALDRGVATIRRNYENTVKKGKLTAEKCEQRMSLLKPTLSYEDVSQSDLVIEAVFEEMGVKQQVFERLDQVMKSGAILASNTSTLDLNRIAGFTKRPQDVIGMHFFSPANVMKLLEVVRGAATARDVLATVMKLSKKIKKTAVVSGVCDGFIGNRMIEQYSRQAMFLLDEGASVEQVDRAVEAFGFAMGPFRMGDLAGNDIGWAIRKRRYVEKPHLKYSRAADRLCELGRFGQKTGAGWYDYQPGDRTAHPSPVVANLLADYRKTIGVAPREISDEEIVQRLVYSLVNEGAHILEEGIALRASDVDIIYLSGYGFPLYRGGPMHYAEQVGLANVVASMKRFAALPNADAAFWQPAGLLARLAIEGKTFAEA
ncbi:MAG: enoyl-CoA hydratase/isomerase family protein [Betaproteobacteria bacterium]|nr:enoyl-CoA hydratase/isomerase family protein [Betaproteobacteria bacterium]